MIKQIFISGLLLFISYSGISCTLGVASGKATEDGRPMLWKTRDYKVEPNIIYYSHGTKYNFISNITPMYGFDESWFGVNEKGFAIANTHIKYYEAGENGPGNGELMNLALGNCLTVNDFIELLDSTNITGRKTTAVFGTIDTTGAAVIFEVNSNHYWMYDANDVNIAPDGYIIRTNFTFTAEGSRGIERYNRSSALVKGFYKKNKLNVRNILQVQMRDMADTTGKAVKVRKKTKKNPYFNSEKNICKYTSIAATVIQGVKENEPAYLSTMWAMIGNPYSSIATPYWPVGETPSVSASDTETSMFNASLELKNEIFNQPEDDYAVHIEKSFEIKELLFKIEDAILSAGKENLAKWRIIPPETSEILKFQNEMALKAYTGINEIKNKYSASNK